MIRGGELFLFIALMMEAASNSETSVNYQTTRRYNPEDSHLHTRSRENLKFYVFPCIWKYIHTASSLSKQVAAPYVNNEKDVDKI
jgi:hypothetical protein